MNFYGSLGKAYRSDYYRRWRARQKRQGFCQGHADRKALPGKTVCKQCVTHRSKSYRRLRALGICNVCRQKKVLKKRSSCRKCLDVRKKHFADSKRRGRCATHPDRKVVRNKTMCKVCLWRRMTPATGWTLECYEAQYNKQKGRCALCGVKRPKATTAERHSVLYGDHCHRTKVLRGLLCNKCNTTLGRFDDDVKAIRRFAVRAGQYLTRDWRRAK